MSFLCDPPWTPQTRFGPVKEIPLKQLPKELDLERLGLDPDRSSRVVLIRRKHGSALYRLWHGDRSFILKWFAGPGPSKEVRSYALLQEHGVPTLPVHGRTQNALLLEDLTASPTWRLAEEQDVTRRRTGTAIARWYRLLHEAGRRILTNSDGAPEFLAREADSLSPAVVVSIVEKLGLRGNRVWKLAADHVEPLKQAMRAMSETLNYNDFHWSNLALSRGRGRSLNAIVFDHHLLGIGMAYSDCRNVVGSLGEECPTGVLGVVRPCGRPRGLAGRSCLGLMRPEGRGPETPSPPMGHPIDSHGRGWRTGKQTARSN